MWSTGERSEGNLEKKKKLSDAKIFGLTGASPPRISLTFFPLGQEREPRQGCSTRAGIKNQNQRASHIFPSFFRLCFFFSRQAGPSLTMELRCYEAAKTGKVKVVKDILSKYPHLDVNWKNKGGWSALYVACEYAQDAIVSILLAHPDIDVNVKDQYGCTPFHLACSKGCTSSVRE